MSGIFFLNFLTSTALHIRLLQFWGDGMRSQPLQIQFLLFDQVPVPPEFHKIQGMWKTEHDVQLMGLELSECRWVSMGKQFGRHWTASLLVVHIAITCELLCILSLLVLRRDQRINCDLGQGLQLVPIEIEAFFGGGHFSRILLGYSLVLGISREQFGTFWNRLLQVGVRWWLRNDPEWSYP